MMRVTAANEAANEIDLSVDANIKVVNLLKSFFGTVGYVSLLERVLSLKTPYNFLKFPPSPELFENIVEQTRFYSALKNIEQPFNTCSTDIRKYPGTCILSSVENF